MSSPPALHRVPMKFPSDPVTDPVTKTLDFGEAPETHGESVPPFEDFDLLCGGFVPRACQSLFPATAIKAPQCPDRLQSAPAAESLGIFLPPPALRKGAAKASQPPAPPRKGAPLATPLRPTKKKFVETPAPQPKKVEGWAFGLLPFPEPHTRVRAFECQQGNSVSWYQTCSGPVVMKVDGKNTWLAAKAYQMLFAAQREVGCGPLAIVKLLGAQLDTDGGLTSFWVKSEHLHPKEGCLHVGLMLELIIKTVDVMKNEWQARGIVHNDIKDKNCFYNKLRNELLFIDLGNTNDTGDVKHWTDADLMRFILGCDQSLTGPYNRGLYDQIVAVFFIGFFMAKQSFKQVLAFTRSEEFTSRFPELAAWIAELSRKIEAEQQAMQDLEKKKAQEEKSPKKSPKRKAEESPERKAQEESPKKKKALEESPKKAQESPKKSPKRKAEESPKNPRKQLTWD